MANLDSSWQASVVKLAQSGNLRAIAFWINRYLLPQGICAQVVPEQSGGFLIQVMCRRMPDRDRLVRFICHRLSKLDSEVIRNVRITAQMVGSSTVLWEKAARIVPASQRQQPAANSNNVYPLQKPTQASTPAIPESKPQQPKSIPLYNSQNHRSSQQPHPIPVGDRTTPSKRMRPVSAVQSSHLLSRQSRLPTWTHTAAQKVSSLQTASLQLTTQSVQQSVDWFVHQTPQLRALILGGSAMTAFLIGCGIEIMGYYNGPFTYQESGATMPGIPIFTGHFGSVKTALGSVAVIQQPVLNPDDPAITLMFSNSAALSRTVASQPAETSAFHHADLLMSNLDNSLASSSTDSAKEPDQDSLSATAERTSDASDKTLKDKAEAADQPASEDKSQAETKAPKTTVQELLSNGVDVVDLASEQVMQGGGTDLAQTLSLLSQSKVYPVGAGQDEQEARRPQIFEVKGKRIAYLGYSDSNMYAAGAKAAGLNASINNQVEADIKAIRDQVDWVVVSYGWNKELRAYPEDWQVNLAHAAIDHGADLVVGYHPTLTQGAEIYNGRAIVYSLGKTLDDYSDKPTQDYNTVALKVTLQDKKMQVDFLPVQVKQGQSNVIAGEAGTAILDSFKQASSLFEQPWRSPTTLDGQLHLSLPAAPNSTMPTTDPFITSPDHSPEAADSPSPSKPSPIQ